jgi:hypothetical protein
MAELLIYIIPTFAGIIGSRYLRRLANFCLMVVVFQLDLGILIGQFRLLAFTPYTVVCIIPALAGIVCDRYFRNCKYTDLQIGARYFLVGPIVTALVVVGVFWIGGVLLAYWNRGQFMPLSFLTTMSVSPGFLIPPLVFIAVAIIAHPLRRLATP